jgi:hypothetical protein
MLSCLINVILLMILGCLTVVFLVPLLMNKD